MSIEEAARILAATQVPPTPSGRKRRRRQVELEVSPEQEEEFEAVGSFQTSHWQNLLLKARVHWARYFCFADEETINNILKDAMGDEIMSDENSIAYDMAFGKIRTWGRQWQCETLKRFIVHVRTSAQQHDLPIRLIGGLQVKDVYEADKETVGDLTPAGVRNHFYRGLNVPIIKHIFHVLNQDIDTSEILNSAASALYCTLYSNMCAYILQHRVKLDGRRAADDQVIFRNFRDCAKEEAFKDVTTDDLPLHPRKATRAKRVPKEKLPPLSKRDDAFRVFGPPPGTSPRQPRRLVDQQQATTGNGAPTGDGSSDGI
jgi:hypothetical protein